MKPLERATRGVTFRSGVIAMAATMVLTPSSASAQRASVPADAPAAAVGGSTGTAIRPFRVSVPEADLADLRQRIHATRWPDKETVVDRSQGPQLGPLQELVRYWGSGYDWRKAEATLNAWPQFMTRIDGVDIHFIHVRSRHSNALPVIISHGWPGSVFEQIKLVGPLTVPTAFGGCQAMASRRGRSSRAGGWSGSAAPGTPS